MALIEFALVMPLLLILALLLIQYGIIMNATNVLTNTSREGARYAALNAFKDNASGYSSTKSYIRQVADQTSVKYDSLQGITIKTPNGVQIGKPINVNLTYDMSRKLFLPRSFWFISVYNQSYTARTTMIIQQGGDNPTDQTFPTPTFTSTPEPTNTPTPLPTATPYPTGYRTPTPVPTNTPAPTNTPVPVPTPTQTPYGWMPPTATPEPTATPTSDRPTPTPEPTKTPKPTNTPKPTPTRRPS